MKKTAALILLLIALVLSAAPAMAEDPRLAPVDDYVRLLDDHGIIVALPELTTVRFNDRIWMYYKIGGSFEIGCLHYDDGLRSSLYLMVPDTYRPARKALVLLIVSALSVSEDEAERLYEKLLYNVVDEYCVIRMGEYTVTLYEPRYSNGAPAGFVRLSVDLDKHQ